MTEEEKKPATRRTAPAAKSDDAAPAPKKKRYTVARTSIHTEDGKFGPGDTVLLTTKEAKHFLAQKALAPYIGDEEE